MTVRRAAVERQYGRGNEGIPPKGGKPPTHAAERYSVHSCARGIVGYTFRMTRTLVTEVPSRVFEELQSLVEAGWFASLDEAVADALRRFVDSHRAELMSSFVREDVEWGLRGTD